MREPCTRNMKLGQLIRLQNAMTDQSESGILVLKEMLECCKRGVLSDLLRMISELYWTGMEMENILSAGVSSVLSLQWK